MPLWELHHSAGSLPAADRQQLAAIITELFAGLPRFYVVVVFHEVDDMALYVGGDLHTGFVRIRVDLIARTLPDADARTRWMARVNAALTPFMEERSLSWEVHMDETSNELWSIQGLRPPPPGSAAEKRWVALNAPVPYETTA